MLFYIAYRNIIWACIISGLAVAGAVLAYFLLRNKNETASDDIKLSAKQNIIMGLCDNAELFADLLEPLFLLASGRTERKDEILDAWFDRAASVDDEDFNNAFVNKFGEIASFKGKKAKYVKCADKILKYVYKAGIERDDDVVVTADEKTAEKYDLIGAGSIEAGKLYDVFVPYWCVEIEEYDESDEGTEAEIVISKGAIR